jgi:hypothetical protein
VAAADEFRDKTTRPNQLWQTNFTYLKFTGWGWFCLSEILDDFSRYIIAWRLCTTMKTGDVTDTLNLALQAVIRRRCCTSHGCSAITDQVTSRVSWQIGWKTGRWIMSAAPRITLKRKARSSAGTNP